MEDNYLFIEGNQRVSISASLKKWNNTVRKIWSSLQNLGFSFHGVVRDHSAVFAYDRDYIVLHHFNHDQPVTKMMGIDSGFHWWNLFEKNDSPGQMLACIEEEGFTFMIPEQVFTDAFLHNLLPDQLWDWHLDSPKSKFLIWAQNGETSLLIEYFPEKELAPYGVGEPLEWPDLLFEFEFISSEWDELFEIGDSKIPTSSIKTTSEALTILEEMPTDALEIARKAIDKVMTSFSRVCVTYSGGKDSHTCLLLVIKYLLDRPECKTEVIVVSSDTGVENTVLKQHILRVKEMVESLPLSIPFYIVKPESDDTFYTCVIGKGYCPPTKLFQWCVRRLKLQPARRELERLLPPGEEMCIILGSRDTESSTRARSNLKFFGEDFYGEHSIPGVKTAAPIRTWTAAEVVTFLVQEMAPWEGYSNHNLINLYGSAAGGWTECPTAAAIINENDAVQACGSASGARMGCVTCTVVKRDDSLRNMALDYPELQPHVEMRTVLKAAQDIRYGGFTGYQRRGRGKFSGGIGDLTIDIRTIILQQMYQLQIPWNEEEIILSYQMVLERESVEGFAISSRFREALFAHLAVHPGIVSAMYSPLWDPWGCGVDRFTEKDIAAIKRLEILGL